MLPLEGLLVVAIEQAVAAPLCTSKLAAAGARVIKIERAEGDFARAYDTAVKGESSYFTWLNQGKESVVLDFKDTEQAAILRQMLKQADVVVQNLSPGALARSGFSTETMQNENPKLIVCNISGYGSGGETSKKRAYDLLVQAESGLISVSGSPEELGRIGVSVCDIGAGMTAHSGILEALIKRGITGIGEELSVSLFDVAADWMTVPYVHAEYGNGAPKPVGLRHPSIAPYGAFQCSDNRLILISIQNEREWERLCNDALRDVSLLADPRYASNNARVKNRADLETDITAITSKLTSSEFEDLLQNANIAYGAINSADNLSTHPAFRSQAYTTANNDAVSMPANPIVWSGLQEQTNMRSPKIGEHTEAVLAEFSPG